MTLNEFIDAVHSDELNDKTILRCWRALIAALGAYTPDQIRELICEGGLIGLAGIENNDGFGSEGMTL